MLPLTKRDKCKSETRYTYTKYCNWCTISLVFKCWTVFWERDFFCIFTVLRFTIIWHKRQWKLIQFRRKLLLGWNYLIGHRIFKTCWIKTTFYQKLSKLWHELPFFNAFRLFLFYNGFFSWNIFNFWFVFRILPSFLIQSFTCLQSTLKLAVVFKMHFHFHNGNQPLKIRIGVEILFHLVFHLVLLFHVDSPR